MKSFIISVLFLFAFNTNSQAKLAVSPECDPSLCIKNGFICTVADIKNDTCEADAPREYQRVCGCAGYGESIWEISKSEKSLRFGSLDECQKLKGEALKHSFKNN